LDKKCGRVVSSFFGKFSGVGFLFLGESLEFEIFQFQDDFEVEEE